MDIMTVIRIYQYKGKVRQRKGAFSAYAFLLTSGRIVISLALLIDMIQLNFTVAPYRERGSWLFG